MGQQEVQGSRWRIFNEAEEEFPLFFSQPRAVIWNPLLTSVIWYEEINSSYLCFSLHCSSVWLRYMDFISKTLFLCPERTSGRGPLYSQQNTHIFVRQKGRINYLTHLPPLFGSHSLQIQHGHWKEKRRAKWTYWRTELEKKNPFSQVVFFLTPTKRHRCQNTEATKSISATSIFIRIYAARRKVNNSLIKNITMLLSHWETQCNSGILGAFHS